jgi:hypothetical protein
VVECCREDLPSCPHALVMAKAYLESINSIWLRT